MRLFRQRTEWGMELSGFGRPFGLGFDLEGSLLVTDMDCHVVVRFDGNLDTFQCHDGSGRGWGDRMPLLRGCGSERPRRAPNNWNGPHAIASDLSGRLLVTCYYQPMVVGVFPDGKAEVLIGPEYLSGPATARLDGQGRLLVAEYAQNTVLAFNPDGTYLGRLGRDAKNDPLQFDPGYGGVPASSRLGGLDRPHMALVLSDDSIVVADTWNNRLQRFLPTGEFLSWLGDGAGWKSSSPGFEGGTRGGIACPVAVDEDAVGRLLVTAWASNQLMLFGPDGRQLRLHGIPPLDKPYDARFHRDGIVVADTHNGRVLILDRITTDTH
jgi:hypothetical protein